MGIRTGNQYIEAVKSRKPDVWLHGKKVANLFEEPVFKQPILEIAKLYDLQHNPEYQDRITHICEETGESCRTQPEYRNPYPGASRFVTSPRLRSRRR